MQKGVLQLKNMKRIAVLLCAFFILVSATGCGKLEISKEIATVNGRRVTKAEYMYYLENVKQQMLSTAGATDAEGFWDSEIDGVKAGEAAKQKALEEMLRVEIACIKADEAGIKASESDISSIRATVKTTDSAQKAQVQSVKDLTGLSDDQLIAVFTKTAQASAYAADLNQKDPEALKPDEAAIAEAYQKDYVHVKHVLVKNTQDTAAEGEAAVETIPAEEFAAQQKAKAEEVLAKAKAGANFDNLVKEYGEDPGMESSPEGYTFTHGAMVAAFEEASYALEVGAISELVESSYGWHIIKRYDLPKSGTEYDNAIQAVTNSLAQDKYNALLDSYKADMTIEVHQGVIDGIKVK
ncbi:MAG: hypothetical protein E7418_04700 [Ruminococcaceae bacterium]|nr:hypothetical protein [Oscillospiraceae bacterium]